MDKVITSNCPTCDKILRIQDTTATILCLNCKSWCNIKVKGDGSVEVSKQD